MDPSPLASRVAPLPPRTPDTPLERLRANLRGLGSRIEAARLRGGHAAPAVTLVAVTKSVPRAALPLLLRAGHAHVGENRVLPAAAKRESAPRGLVWHGIGHLQTNKARKAVSTFDVFHALDSLRLASELEAVLAASPAERRWPVYVQVNAANDPAKGGFRPEETLGALRTVAALPHLEVVGLMTMARETDLGEAARACFRALRELRDEAVRVGAVVRADLGLSMGMSSDFEPAVEEGATIVRIGRAVWDGVGFTPDEGPAGPRAEAPAAPSAPELPTVPPPFPETR